MSTLRALDISYGANLAYEDPDRFRAWCKARKVDGYKLLIVNCWLGNATPLGAEEALRISREVGLYTAAYLAVHDGRPGSEHVHKAMEGAGREWPLLEFVAVDCEEIKGVSLHPETIGDALYAVDATGQLGIIYTRGSYWREVQNNTTQFAPLALWEAFYNGDANLYGAAASLKLPFGGFAAPIGKQYLGNHELDGVTVDESVFSRTWLESLTTVKGERMAELTDEVRNALDALRGFSHEAEVGNLWEQARDMERLEHEPEGDRLSVAAKQLQDASRVLDKAFGIGS